MVLYNTVILCINTLQHMLIISGKSVTMAQWENEWISLSVLPVALVQFPANGGVFQGIVPWLIKFFQPVLSRKWLKLPSMAPQNLWRSRRKA